MCKGLNSKAFMYHDWTAVPWRVDLTQCHYFLTPWSKNKMLGFRFGQLYYNHENLGDLKRVSIHTQILMDDLC